MKSLKFGFNQWKNPDHSIRLDYARRSKNEEKLLYLALNDVHETVRLAAVKGLRKEISRFQVIQASSCDRSLRMAVDLLTEDHFRGQTARQKNLLPELRMEALQAMDDPAAAVLELISDPNETIALYAIQHCPETSALEALYSEDLSDARCLAILEKVENEALALEIFQNSSVTSRRVAALRKIESARLLSQLYFEEHEQEVRSAIVERIDGDAELKQFFDDEDDETIRARIVKKIKDPEWLSLAATNDYNLEIRRTATESLDDPMQLIRVAQANGDRQISEIILGKQLSEEALSEIALTGANANARIGAVMKIADRARLEHIASHSGQADTIWFASRQLGKLPIESLRKIQSPETLIRVAESDQQKLVRFTALRQISDKRIVERLAQSDDTELAFIAASLLKEVAHSSGIRFLDIPERPYQMSIFPITGEQFAQWKTSQGKSEEAAFFQSLQDLPVTNVSIEDAKAFCAWLGTLDNAQYRLPYFHEWQHAALADSSEWFSTGKMRAFANAEQMDLVLFGIKEGPRPLHESISNPWGLLDMIGNVMEWTHDDTISERMLAATIPLDELAQNGPLQQETIDRSQYAHASGNHWGDRRIRKGRWKRLVHRENLNSSAAKKIGFRVVRTAGGTNEKPIEYQLVLDPQVAPGYTVDQVCWELSRTLQEDHEDICRRYSVAPLRITLSRDYERLLRLKQTWESCGAITDLTTCSPST